jgi:hypothetical protein
VPVEDELLDRLAEASFGDWVGARDALAKELRGAGRREEADELKKLRKPPAPVWAANQLARRRPRCVRRLVEAAESLRTAQASRREDFAVARAEERDALEAAVAEGRSILGEAGAESEAMASRLEKTLRFAASAPATAELLEAGRLTEELESAGFDALLGAFDAGAASAATPPKKRAPSAKAQVEAARKRVEQARKDAADARKAAREASRKADAARRDWERARDEADAAAAAADEADGALEDARAALAELRHG